MKSVWQQLKSERFDALLDMQVALRASALSLGIKAKYRIGFSKNRTKKVNGGLPIAIYQIHKAFMF